MLNLHSTTIMGSHVRSGKLVYDSFRSCSSRFIPKTQISLPSKRFCQFEHSLIPAWNRAKSHVGISSYSHIALQGRANKNLLSNPFLNEARRFYYVDQYNNVQKQHRKSRGLIRRWFLVGVLTIVTCCSGFILKIYHDHLEIVPYTRRTRLILFSESTSKNLRDAYLKKKKEPFEERILPETHPESIRVRRIAQDIIDAYEDKIQRQGSQISTTSSHSDGSKKWEVLVVSGHGNAASTIASGKIVVFDWVFEHITSDAEVAFLVGSEIGHIVARHFAENMTRAYGFMILQTILNSIGLWDAFKDDFTKRIIRIIWRQQFEADYIGMRLSALAGYDPREAPKLLEKMDKFSTDNNISRPPPKLRAEFLSFPQMMNEPLSIYIRECQSRS